MVFSKNRLPKLLFLTNSYPDSPNSFRGHFIKKLALDIKKLGFTVTVVTPKIFKENFILQKEQGIDVLRFPYPSGEKQLLEYKTIPYIRMIFFFISGLISTFYILKRDKCNIIFAHWVVPSGLLAAIVGKLLKVPVIVYAHGSDIHTYANKNFLLKIITSWVLKSASSIIAASNEIQKIILTQFGISDRIVSVIPVGVDTKQFFCKKSTEFSNSISNIIYIGGLYQPKGLDILLDSCKILFQKYKSLNLTLVGDGPFKQNLLKVVETTPVLKERVRFVGAVSHSKIPDLLNCSHIFILPSLNEGAPSSLLEAMSCGIPSIATKVGEIPLIIEHGKDGLLIDSGSSEDIIFKVEQLLNNTDFYNKISKNCRKKAINYSRNISVEKIKDICLGAFKFK